MKQSKFLHAILGFGFFFFGLAMAVVLIMIVTGLSNPNAKIPIAVTGLVIPITSVFSIGMGVLILRLFPYEVTCDSNGLTMLFLFRKERVNWEKIEWYKNIGIKVYVWIALKYYSIRKDSICARKAIVLLPSNGTILSWSANDYLTLLDQYIPNKKVLKNK